MNNTNIKVKQGSCPKCGNGNLIYGTGEPIEESISYEVSCPRCGFKGNEYYELEFIQFIDNEGNEYS